MCEDDDLTNDEIVEVMRELSGVVSIFYDRDGMPVDETDIETLKDLWGALDGSRPGRP